MAESRNKEHNFKNYPNIVRAIKEMALCNNVINRHYPEKQFMFELEGYIACCPIYPTTMNHIERWISSLTDEQIEILVDGEETEMERLLLNAPPSTGELFVDVFDVMSGRPT